MPLLTTVPAILISFLAMLAIITSIGAMLIARAHPPAGQMIDVEGGAIHVVQLPAENSAAPNALPVVLLHGASANLESMRSPLADLLARNHRVILMDRPGHGWSVRDDLHASTPRAQAMMIDAALEKLGVARAIVVAHSWAGGLAAAMALDHPLRVAGMVLLAPATHPWYGKAVWYNRLAALPIIGEAFARMLALPVGYFLLEPGARGAFLPQTMQKDYVRSSATALLLRPHTFRANAVDLVTLNDALEQQAARYPEINVPVWIISGDVDKTVSADIHARAFIAAVKDAKLEMLPGVGHIIQNAAPDRVVQGVAWVTERIAAQEAASMTGEKPVQDHAARTN